MNSNRIANPSVIEPEVQESQVEEIMMEEQNDVKQILNEEKAKEDDMKIVAVEKIRQEREKAFEEKLLKSN